MLAKRFMLCDVFGRFSSLVEGFSMVVLSFVW